MTSFTGQAAATGSPQLTAAPADNLDSASVVHLTLTGADANEGQAIYFAQCVEPTDASHCGPFSPQAGVTVANGAATYDLKVFYGDLPGYGAGAPSCTEADNGTCDIVAFTSSATKVASVAITFEAPPTTTPKMALSKSTGLKKGDKVTVTVTNVPDLVRALFFEECNAKGITDGAGCHDIGSAIVKDNAGRATVRVHVGVVGSATRSGAPVSCKSSTNGQCVIRALSYPGYKPLLNGPVIRFAKP